MISLIKRPYQNKIQTRITVGVRDHKQLLFVCIFLALSLIVDRNEDKGSTHNT